MDLAPNLYQRARSNSAGGEDIKKWRGNSTPLEYHEVSLRTLSFRFYIEALDRFIYPSSDAKREKDVLSKIETLSLGNF